MSISDIIRVVMAALHDVSKHDDLRLDPKANASDTRAQRDATNTTSIHPVTDATTTKGFLKTGSGQVLGNDGSNNIGLFGFDSTGQMVVKVAKPGFDADTASNDNLVFNSSQNVFKIVKSGTISINATATTAGTPIVVTVAHGLSIVPAIFAFRNIGDALYKPLPDLTIGGTSTSGGAITFTGYLEAYVDTTTIYAEFRPSLSANYGTLSVKYYLLQETAN